MIGRAKDVNIKILRGSPFILNFEGKARKIIFKKAERLPTAGRRRQT
jgi:hypothetical protein